MKVNPLGISAYTKIDPTKTGAERHERGGAITGTEPKAKSSETLTLRPHSSATESAVAMKSSTEFASMISPEERVAIDMLFEQYANRQAAETSYGSGGRTQAGPRLGAKVDYRA